MINIIYFIITAVLCYIVILAFKAFKLNSQLLQVFRPKCFIKHLWEHSRSSPLVQTTQSRNVVFLLETALALIGAHSRTYCTVSLLEVLISAQVPVFALACCCGVEGRPNAPRRRQHLTAQHCLSCWWQNIALWHQCAHCWHCECQPREPVFTVKSYQTCPGVLRSLLSHFHRRQKH